MSTSLASSRPEHTTITLTDRQIEILGLVLEGKTTKEVAKSLFVSKRTIDFHLSRIYQKLSATNRVQAIRRATELGLVPHILS